MHGPLVRSCIASFAPSQRFVGMLLARDGAVALDDVTDLHADGTVQRHGIAYRVRLDAYAESGRRRWRCSCRPGAGPARCEHVFAVLIALDQLQSEIGDDAGTAFADGAEQDEGVAVARGRHAVGWRRRLAPALPLPSLRPNAAGALPVVEYYVEIVRHRREDVLAVHVRTRVLRKNGGMSVARTTRIDEDVIERLPAPDRSLLGWMRRDQESSHYYSTVYSGRGMSVAAPWLVTAHTLAPVTALLAATGRVYGVPVPVGDAAPVPLRLDAAEPFEFELRVERTGDQRVEVHGELRRGEELLPLQGRDVRDIDCLLVGDRLVRIDCHGAGALAQVFARGRLQLPADELSALLRELAAVRGAPRFLAPCLAALPVEPPTGVVLLKFPAGTQMPLGAELQFDYGGVLVAADAGALLVADDAAPRRRDAAAERDLHGRVLAAGLEPAFGGGLQCERGALASVATRLQQAGLRVLAAGKRLRSLVASSARVGTGIDWFEVGAQFDFDGLAVRLPALLRGKITPDGFVELGDGSTGILPESWLRRIAALRSLGGDVDGEVVRLPSSRALLLDALLAARDDDMFVVDERFAELRRQLARFRRVRTVAAPASFRGVLRPYQRQGLGWLRFLQQFGLGGCLADDMGLGKTVQVLAHLLAVRPKAQGERRPSLLVAPRSVLANWRTEAERFAPSLRVLDFGGADRWTNAAASIGDADLVLTTYGLVRNDAVRFADEQRRFRYVILDEAQAVKNADSQNAKAVRLLAAEHRLALTGTPVENHLGELWSLFEFLNPGMLGRLPAFRALFGKDAGDTAMAQNRELVQRALRPVLLRRTKAQVLKDLPDKTEQTLWCELEPAQRKRYDELRRHYRTELLEGGTGLDGKQRFVVLEALLRLRQAACHEGLLDRGFAGAPSAKFEELLPRLEDLAQQGHKALVFSQFTSLLDLLEPQLRQRKLVFERLDGRTKNRAARVDRFQQDPACPVFLISLKAGGFGLNLTAASYVFLLDPWWNPAVEMQAIDRAHRIGQRRAVHAYRVVCRDTVEERVLELQQQKRALCEAILGNERSLLQDLTRADLELLLG